MTEATLLWRLVEQSVDVLYRRLDLVDQADTAIGTEAASQTIDGDEWFRIGSGWLALLSGGTGFFPRITMEAWTAEPADDLSEPWASSAEIDGFFPSGTLAVAGMSIGALLGPKMQLPWSDNNAYAVRLHVDPDPRLGLVEDLLENENNLGPDPIERWLLQFWALEQ